MKLNARLSKPAGRPPIRSLLCALGVPVFALALAAVGAAPATAQVGAPIDTLLRANSAEWSDGFDTTRADRLMERTEPTISAVTIGNVERAIQQYSMIAARGGWPRVPADATLRLGARSPSVEVLRQRLLISGDLLPDQNRGRQDVFDSFVDQAVRRFQQRHGIPADGKVGPATLTALNVPAEVRLQQLQINLGRLRDMSFDLGQRYVMVNIPAAQLEAVENGYVVSRHTVIVGKVDRQTPILSSKIYEVNFNPFWTVPASIIKKDLIPIMQKDPEYLTRYRIRVYDRGGTEIPPQQINWHSDEATHYMFRQDPGEINSLGSMRINFHNKYSVYLHDTPTKTLFGQSDRFLSSGCVRVQGIRDLVTWLLRDTPGWTRADIDSVTSTGEQVTAKLAREVPLHIVYITAWANSDGAVHFREDIYNHDGLGSYGPSGAVAGATAPAPAPVSPAPANGGAAALQPTNGAWVPNPNAGAGSPPPPWTTNPPGAFARQDGYVPMPPADVPVVVRQ